jgi:hypothetical protein
MAVLIGILVLLEQNAAKCMSMPMGSRMQI